MKKTVADNIVRLRKKNNLTQEKLASLLGVTFQSVSKWETAQTFPDITIIPKLADIFGVSVDTLLGYQAEKLKTTHYEEKYRGEKLYWGSHIWSRCYDVLRLMPPDRPLRILDIGCGEGQAAVFFARNGYAVTAFDIAEAGIEKGKEMARAWNVDVDFFCADMLQYEINGCYDVIYASGVLQYIPHEERARIVESIKRSTNKGGINILNVFVEKPFIDTAPDWEATEHIWKSGELFGYYHDWLFETSEEVIFDCSSSGIPHKHCMDVLIARKF